MCLFAETLEFDEGQEEGEEQIKEVELTEAEDDEDEDDDDDEEEEEDEEQEDGEEHKEYEDGDFYSANAGDRGTDNETETISPYRAHVLTRHKHLRNESMSMWSHYIFHVWLVASEKLGRASSQSCNLLHRCKEIFEIGDVAVISCSVQDKWQQVCISN